MKLIVALICHVAACALLAGCQDPIEKMQLTDAERERVLVLQNPFGEHLLRLDAQAGGNPVVLGLGPGCRLYRATLAQGVIIGWQRVDGVDGVNVLGSDCGNRLTFDLKDGYVRFQFCSTAVGAGGGCGGGSGDYRSSNGLDWESRIDEKTGWQPVAKRTATPSL